MRTVSCRYMKENSFLSLYEREQFLVGLLYLLYISPGAAAIYPKECCIEFFRPIFSRIKTRLRPLLGPANFVKKYGLTDSQTY